jgi:hypothetical protein
MREYPKITSKFVLAERATYDPLCEVRSRAGPARNPRASRSGRWLPTLQAPGIAMTGKGRGPGPVKTWSLPLATSRQIKLWQSADYRLRELFETADVMSEGRTRNEPDGATYYGSTSVLLPFVSHGGFVPVDQATEVLRLVASDPHARLRAVRIACLEAQVRSGAPMGRVRAELFVRNDTRGIRVDVEVEARVFKNSERPGPLRKTTVRVTPARREARASARPHSGNVKPKDTPE